jgi:SET domain-containing protein
MTTHLEIRASPIQGLGLFTSNPIKKNVRICDYIGVEMTLKEFKQQYGAYKNNSLNTYLLKRINKILVAKDCPDNLVNYINESINPNCILKKRGLYALKDIEPETELTLLYPKNYNRNYSLVNTQL